MKKLLSVLLAACMLLALVACGGSDGSAGGEAGTKASEAAGEFKAGFGMVDITPRESVPMASYGDDKDRWSEGLLS